LYTNIDMKSIHPDISSYLPMHSNSGCRSYIFAAPTLWNSHSFSQISFNILYRPQDSFIPSLLSFISLHSICLGKSDQRLDRWRIRCSHRGFETFPPEDPRTTEYIMVIYIYIAADIIISLKL